MTKAIVAIARPLGIAVVSPAQPRAWRPRELEQIDLRVQVGGWDDMREINRQANITCSV